MMPKGVEHIVLLVIGITELTGVKIPMMPKGVEHKMTPEELKVVLECEDSNDAKRR